MTRLDPHDKFQVGDYVRVTAPTFTGRTVVDAAISFVGVNSVDVGVRRFDVRTGREVSGGVCEVFTPEEWMADTDEKARLREDLRRLGVEFDTIARGAITAAQLRAMVDVLQPQTVR